MRTTSALTQREIVEAFKRREERPRLRDGQVPGLMLRLGPTKCTWFLIRRGAADAGTIEIGTYPRVTLTEARRLAVEAWAGVVSAAERARHERESEPAPDTTLSLFEMFERYHELAIRPRKHWFRYRASIHYVFRDVWHKHASEMRPSDLQRIADAHPARASAVAAVRMLRPVLRWAARSDYCAPGFADIVCPHRDTSGRERVLSRDELRRVWPALTGPYGNACRLILYTLARRQEAAGARVQEFDIENAQWAVPAERVKGGRRSLIVPLSRQAVALVRTLVAGREPDDLLFVTVRGNPLNDWGEWQRRLHRATGTAGWHRHDLRRTGATLAGDLGVFPHIIEAMLGHSSAPTPVAEVYNRSRYLHEHKRAVQRLADEIDRIVSSG